MKKNYLLLSMLLSMLSAFNGYSQTYSAYASTPSNDDYNYVNYSNDTMYYTFNSLALGAYEDATLIIDGSAYFEPSSYYNVYGPGSVLVGTYAAPNIYTCQYFTDSITIPFATLNAYGGNVVFKFVKQGNIYPYCSNAGFRAKLQYKYCTTGVPVQQASFSLANTILCQSNDPLPLAGSPNGGIFSGAGVTNGILYPAGLPYGVYHVTYTLTEANGCYTQDSAQFTVFENPADESILTCQNTAPILNTGTISTVYATDKNLSDVIGSGTTATLNTIISNPTEVYSANVSSPFYYQVNSLDTTNFQLVDHAVFSGDDRGGIAITANYVYVVGDENTARYDLDLQNGIDLQRRDGIVTDLAQLKLYTLYNTSQVPHTPNEDSDDESFTINALRALNEDLTYGDEIILLTHPVTIGGDNQAVILAGHNEIIVGTAWGNFDFYHISILNGLVTPMGQHNLETYGSENWADWGMSGFDGTDRHAYFRHENDSLVDFNFTTNTATSIFSITDFSDLSSFIAHPVNHRFYAHFESNTNTFGGDEENLIYFQISDTASRLAATPLNYACPNKITFTFNTLDLGADTTVCSEDGLYIIPGGNGYHSYTWNGVNNDFNAYAVQSSGDVVLSVVDEANCTLTDTVNVTITECTAGIGELEETTMQVYPVPNNGVFQVTFDALTEDAQIVMIDVQGKQITNQVVSQGTTSVAMNLDVQPGIYFVRLVSENGTTQRAISIQ